MVQKPLYQVIASLLGARKRCEQSAQHQDWYTKHTATLQQIARDLLPSGSGWDCATALDLGASTPNCIVLYGEYHHMNDGGMYDGWTAHRIIVRPCLESGFTLRITGRDRNEIKDYLHEMFDCALRGLVTQDTTAPYRYRVASAEVQS